MNKRNWEFIIITAKSLSRVRHINLSNFLLIVSLIIGVTGVIGMARLLWFTGSYASAKFGVYEAYRENRGLMMKLKFLTKYINQENARICELIEFEDDMRLQYGMDKISQDVRQAGVGGRPSPEEVLLSNMLDPVLIKAEAVRESLSVLLRKAELQDSTLSQVSKNLTIIQKKWSQRPSIRPTEGRITSSFGNRFHPIEERIIFHDGLDIANRSGSPIYATADGSIKYVGAKDNYGKMVTIEHDGMCETVYAHLQQCNVTRKQMVKRGDLIGLMGNTGRSTGSHLHYEVRVNGRPINPQNFILPTDVMVD